MPLIWALRRVKSIERSAESATEADSALPRSHHANRRSPQSTGQAEADSVLQ